MTPREQVLAFLRTVERATLWEINQGIKHSYYANGAKHLGAVLSRLVNRGLVQRVKKGVFMIAPPKKAPEQLDLNIGLFK